MNFTDEQFDRAFAEFQEFGPRRRIRVEERWQEGFPEVPIEELSALRARCEEIESFAVGLACQVRDEQMSDDAARRRLAEKYPSLTSIRLDRTWSQAMYFSMK